MLLAVWLKIWTIKQPVMYLFSLQKQHLNWNYRFIDGGIL